MKKLLCAFALIASFLLPLTASAINLGYISSGTLDVQVEVPLQYANHSTGITVINTDTNEIVADYAWIDFWVSPLIWQEGVGGAVTYSSYNAMSFSLWDLPPGNYAINAGGQGTPYQGWSSEPFVPEIYWW